MQTKELTDKQIRVAVAERMNWPMHPLSTLCEWIDSRTGISMLSDPLEDLNACAKMEEMLRAAQVHTYGNALIEITGASGIDQGQSWLNTWALYHASARQRCLAFLKCFEGEKS